MICLAPDPHVYQQLVSAGGGFLGGVSMLVYMRPYGLGDGLRRVVVSTVAATFLAALVADKALGSKDPQILAAAAFLIGFCSWSLLGAIAQFFENRKGDDIVTMVKSYKDAATPEVLKPKPTEPVLPRRTQIDNPDG